MEQFSLRSLGPIVGTGRGAGFEVCSPFSTTAIEGADYSMLVGSCPVLSRDLPHPGERAGVAVSEFDSGDRDVDFLSYRAAYIQHPEKHALAHLTGYGRNGEAVGHLYFDINNGLSVAGHHSDAPGPPLGAAQPFSDEARTGLDPGWSRLQSPERRSLRPRQSHLIGNSGLTGNFRLKNDTSHDYIHIRCHFDGFRRFIGF